VRTETEIYQDFAEYIMSIIGEEWQQVTLTAALGKGFGEIYGKYIKTQFDTTEHDFDIDYTVYDAFVELRHLYATTRNGDWRTAKFVLDSTGEFKVSFDYEPHWLDDPELV